MDRWRTHTASPLLVALLLGCAAHHPASQSADASGVPAPPGQLVDIGGVRLHLHCLGSGAPTVVLEGGAGDGSSVWERVQADASSRWRVCRHDRGGYAWSEAGARPRSAAQLALELHTLLARAGERPPYVLVGQSFGGSLVRWSVRDFPDEVAGVVLVDAVHEDQHIVVGGEAVRIRSWAQGRARPAPHVAHDTALEDQARHAPLEEAEPVPPEIARLGSRAAAAWAWEQRLALQGLARRAELDWSPEDVAVLARERAAVPHPLGSRPLVVLARGEGGYPPGLGLTPEALEAERRAGQADLAALSSRGQVRFVPGVGHNIHLERPELVVAAIAEVAAALR